MKEILADMTEEDRHALEREIRRIMVKNLEEAMARMFLGQHEREKTFMNIPVVIDYSMAPNTFRIAEPKPRPTYDDKILFETLIGKPKSLIKGLFN